MSEVERFVRLETSDGPRWARKEAGGYAILRRAPYESVEFDGAHVPEDAAKLLCPVVPRQILAIGKNYRAHASEMGGAVPEEPLVFAKAVSSLLAHGGTVILPGVSERVDYEGELGVVIGRSCRRVRPEHALDFVFGYVPVCDVTARDLQKKDGQWTRAKGFDTFCPVGPELVRGLDPGRLALELRVNGQTRQKANTADMVFDVPRLVAHISSFLTLEAGDLIVTGTPEGVGPLSDGDHVNVAITGMGSLEFLVRSENTG